MADILPTPKATTGDLLHGGAKFASAFLPGIEGILVNQLVGSITPPLQRRQQEFLKQIAERLSALESTGILEIHDLGSNEGFLSILVQAARVATHNHRKEKLQLLQRAVIGALRSRSGDVDLQQMFVRYLDELTPEHVQLLTFLRAHQTEEWMQRLETYEALHAQWKSAGNFSVDTDLFSLWCEDLTTRWLVRISTKVREFPGVVTNDVLISAFEAPGSRVLVTEVGKRFLDFLDAGA